jgi:hypothetical protein
MAYRAEEALAALASADRIPRGGYTSLAALAPSAKNTEMWIGGDGFSSGAVIHSLATAGESAPTEEVPVGA